MKFSFVITKSFDKNLRKLSPTEQKQVAQKLKVMQLNPYHPSLRTKKIKGFKDLFECSVNMDIRILWQYKENHIILILDIEHHSIVDNL